MDRITFPAPRRRARPLTGFLARAQQPWHLSPLMRRARIASAVLLAEGQRFGSDSPAAKTKRPGPRTGLRRRTIPGCVCGMAVGKPTGSSRRKRLLGGLGPEVSTCTLGTLEPGLFPAASFEAVFGWMVVEHLPEPKTLSARSTAF